MSGYNNNYSDQNDEFDGGGGGLRKMLEQVLEENKSLRALIEGKEREKSATALLKELGIDPAVAELIPKDADPAQWIKDKAHLFDQTRDKAELLEESTATTEPEIVAAPDDDPALVAEREALAAMQDAAESGSPASISPDVLDRMNKIQSEDELLKFFQSNGAQ